MQACLCGLFVGLGRPSSRFAVGGASLALGVAFVAGAAVAQSTTQNTPATAIEPPVPVEQVSPIYPIAYVNEHPEAPKDVDVTLVVSIDATGKVTDVVVQNSGGAVFDQAAIEAMKQWIFHPALKNKVPVAVKILVPVHFGPPAEENTEDTEEISEKSDEKTPQKTDGKNTPDTKPNTKPDTNLNPNPENPDVPEEEPPEVATTVRKKRPAPPRTASELIIAKEVMSAVPKQDMSSAIASIPGIYVAKPEGDAVAQEIFLRGFDAEHGQDVELTMGNMPLNQLSHIHGQGYADINFLIPEVVRSVRATEGVYSPKQGDFAVAGSLDFSLGVDAQEREKGSSLVKLSYGSYNSLRLVGVFAPQDQSEETFAAVAVKNSQGYGDNRGSLSGSVLGQLQFALPNDFTATAHVGLYSARSNLAGVLRRDDVLNNRVGFYESYDDVSANAQSASTLRAQTMLTIEQSKARHEKTALSVWMATMHFRSRMNFTGYLERSQVDPNVLGRGDLIEQSNSDFSFGASALYRAPRYELTDWLQTDVELGVQAKSSSINQAQNLLAAPQNETWDQRIDATIQGSDLGSYIDMDWHVGEQLRVRGGARLDVLAYDIDDRLGNFIPRFQRQTHIVGFRRTANGFTGGPRLNVEYFVQKPAQDQDQFSLSASYGKGFRSPQALLLEEGENAPYADVHSVEVGGKWQNADQTLSLIAAAYATFLSDDLAFEPGDGSLQPIGPTSRKGGVIHLVSKPYSWALISASATYVYASLDAPPRATAENPVPSFRQGELLPYVPPLVLRLDAAADEEITQLLGKPVRGHAGIGATFLSARPLPYAQYADPVFTLESSLGLTWQGFSLSMDAYNVLNTQYAQTEYAFVSNWNLDDIPSKIPTRHFAAGAPFQAVVTLGAAF